MSPLANPLKRHPEALLHHGVLLACGLGFASLIAPAARADNQYCTNSSANCFVKKPPFNSATDTYFWSPNSTPVNGTVFKLQTIGPTGTVKRLTLRGSSNVTLNASGTAQQEVLIGSLGSNSLQGGAGGDTYVIGNTYSVINSLPNCDPANANDCVKTRNPANLENDTVQLVNGSTEVIYIDRCLQVTADGNPGLGGNKIGTATKVNSSDGAYQPITDQNNINPCPTAVAAISNPSLRNLALGSQGDLQAPWQRWWSASTAWNRAIGWLQQAITALIQGPHAVAQPWPTNQGTMNINRVPSLPSDQHEAKSDLGRGVPCQPCYPGVARLIQSREGNFLNASGDRIVVDGSTRTFQGQPLSSNSKASRVYPQLNNKDMIPLNQGYVFVYHQQLGILASYGNDKYPYGTQQNPGTVIAQLVLPDGSALLATSIDSVTTANLRPRY